MMLRDHIELMDESGTEVRAYMRAHVGSTVAALELETRNFMRVARNLQAVTEPRPEIQTGDRIQWRAKVYTVSDVSMARRYDRDHHQTITLA